MSVVLTVAMVVAMASNRVSPDIALVSGLAILLGLGILEPGEALGGFANPAVATVAALFVVAAAVRETGALDIVSQRVLGRPRARVSAQLRLMVPVSGVSAFLNNTPIVAMMVPVVEDWSRRTGIQSSKLLIPLSYAAILGGTCTLIGTSTNLVVAGLSRVYAPDVEIGLFDIAVLGVPCTLVGIAYVVLASGRLLPDRGAPGARTRDNPKEYTVAMRVEPGSAVVGRTIEEAGLRHLPGLYLIEIERDGHLMTVVSPDVRLKADDRLVFTGVIDGVVDLRKIRGLVPATNQVEKLGGRPERYLVEAVVAARSWLVGRNVRESRFRIRYNAVIVAVHRQGERVRQKIGDIVIRAGDTLLLETYPSFVRDHRHDVTFALVSAVEGSARRKHEKAWLATVVIAGIVIVNVTGLLDILTAVLLGAGAMVVFGCIEGHEARRSLDLRVLLTIGAAFGVGAALEKTGAARAIGLTLVDLMSPFGALGLLVGIYVSTAFLTELISNNAAAALMFPIAHAAGVSASVPMWPLVLVVMMAASASFSTPIGYQTNLMVYGPGGYRFADFLRFGLPLQILVALTVAGVLSLIL